MKSLWTFYSVFEGSGLASGRVGMSILASVEEIENEPGRYNPFDVAHETVLIDLYGLFTMFDDRLSAVKTAPYAFSVKTAIGTSWFCPELKQSEFATVSRAINLFGYLMPMNQMLTLAEFALLIEEHYSLDNDRTRTVVECLELLHRREMKDGFEI